MKTEQIIKEYKSSIDQKLSRFLKDRQKVALSISPYADELLENIHEFCLRGGKRIRPILVIIGYKALGGKDAEAIINASLAVELMEAYLLIHDDIMDQDELRRGYLTMHKTYEEKCKRSSLCADAGHFGESVALLAGDILAVFGTEAIINSSFPVERKLAAIGIFNKAVVNTCFGQLLDIRYSHTDLVSTEEITKVYSLKTALYTFDAPLKIGATLAGASERTLKEISKFSMPLGRSFQLKDDILGLFGARQKIGKPVGSDIREGKKTMLVIRAMEKAEPKDRAFMHKCLGNYSITEQDVKRVKEIVEKTGALEYTQARANDLADEARLEIRESRLNKEGKEFLLGLVDYVVNREH